MDRDGFWEVINRSRQIGQGSQDAQFGALEKQLRAMGVDEVTRFYEHFSHCLAIADCNNVYAAAAIIDGFWVSDDAFTYFLEWLISQGKTIFDNAIRDPESLTEVVEKGQSCRFEGFGYVAARVWEEKTGQKAEILLGQVATVARAPDGVAWQDDDDLKYRFPRLWEKFSWNNEG